LLLLLFQKVIYIAGDNDIGGEGMDMVTHNKISRFREHFPSSERESYKFVDFVCVSVINDKLN